MMPGPKPPPPHIGRCVPPYTGMRGRSDERSNLPEATSTGSTHEQDSPCRAAEWRRAFAVGCGGGDGTPGSGEALSAHKSMDVGATVPFSVWIHCGVRYTTIDRVTWQTRDGQGSNDPERPEMIDGTLNGVSEDRAVFTSEETQVKFVYRPALDAKYYCQ